VVTDFTTLDAISATDNIAFSSLTGAQVLTLLQAAGGFTTAAQQTNLGTTDAAAATVTRKSILLVQDNHNATNNAGEYKVFDVSFGNASGTSVEQFTAATLLGTIDFGSSQTFAANAANGLAVTL
jgi:hypothetical protein